MPRPRTGTIYRHGDHWDIQITLPNGGRSRPMCQEPGMSEAKARDRALRLTQIAAKEALPGSNKKAEKGVPAPGEAVAEWSERWFVVREARGLSAVENDRGRFRKWVLPRLGQDPIAGVTREDIERLVEHLDASVRAGGLSWKSALNVWGLVAKMFDDACSGKVRALRARADNPAAGVRGPDRGTKKAKAYLYPSEFQELISCDAVPLQWRRAIAVATYLYARAGELRALTWDDIDVERGLVQIHRGTDREGATKSTKTGIARRFAVEAALVPLLQAMHTEAGGAGQVIALPDDRHLARALRGLLEKAGLDRADLFAKDATRKNMTWHDLRATGLTWLAIRGDDPLKIMQRAGHSEFRTTQGYVREAEAVREGFGEVFPSLPPDLLGGSDVPGNAPPKGGVSPGESPGSTLSIGNHGGGAGNRTRVRVTCGALIWPDLALIRARTLRGDSSQFRSFPHPSGDVGARSGARYHREHQPTEARRLREGSLLAAVVVTRESGSSFTSLRRLEGHLLEPASHGRKRGLRVFIRRCGDRRPDSERASMKNRIVNVLTIKDPIKPSPGFTKKGLSDFKLDLMGLRGFGCAYCSSNDEELSSHPAQEALGPRRGATRRARPAEQGPIAHVRMAGRPEEPAGAAGPPG
jgi:integrase